MFLVEVYQLTELSDFASSFLSALSAAIAKGNLPTLSHLSFEDCRFGLRGQLCLLFQCTWPSLTDLNFEKCCLDASDIDVLSLAHEKGFFPVLKSLSLGDMYTFNKLGIYDLLKKHLTNTTRFRLANRAVCFGEQRFDDGLRLILEAMPNLESLAMERFFWNMGKLAEALVRCKLKIMDISHCSGVAGNLRMFIHQGFPTLNSLVLSDCGLNPDDLRCLAQACVAGRLPELTHLDISRNPDCAGQLDSLFDFSCAWDNLLSLNLQQRCIKTECEVRELFSQDVEILFRQIETGCLCNVEEISFTAYNNNYPRKKRGVPWKNVKTINILAAVSHMSERTIIEESNILERGKVLKSVVQMVRQGRLPSLETLSVVLPGYILCRLFKSNYTMPASHPFVLSRSLSVDGAQ